MKLAITLRYLTTGDLHMSCGLRVAHKTVAKVVREICQVIYEHYQEEHSNFQQQKRMKGLSRQWNFHRCKHVKIQARSRSESVYFDYKETL
jgi:predicted small metal-binding protein